MSLSVFLDTSTNNKSETNSGFNLYCFFIKTPPLSPSLANGSLKLKYQKTLRSDSGAQIRIRAQITVSSPHLHLEPAVFKTSISTKPMI